MHIGRSDNGGKIGITLALEVRFWISWYQMKALDKAFLMVTPTVPYERVFAKIQKSGLLP